MKNLALIFAALMLLASSAYAQSSGIYNGWPLVSTNGGLTGVGTTAPANAFDIYGSATIGSYAGTATSGSNQLLVSGSVGIGTQKTSSSNKLEVNGAATIGYNDIAAPSNGLRVQGNVEIGTTSGLSGNLQVTGNTAGNLTLIAAQNTSNSASANAYIQLFNDAGNSGYMQLNGHENSGGGGVDTLTLQSGSGNLLLNAASSDLVEVVNNIFEMGTNGFEVGYVSTPPSSGGIISGTLGIGTATVSASNKLEVNGSTSIGYPDVAAPANGLIVQGNVSIGTTFSNSTLLINNNTSANAPAAIHTTDIHLIGADGTPTEFLADGFGGQSGAYYRRADGTNGSPTAVQSGENLGVIGGVRAYNGSAYSGTVGGISVLAANNFTTSSEGTDITFTVTPIGTSTSGAAMELFSTGGVSIGTTFISTAAPTNGLLVQGNVGIGTTSTPSPLNAFGLPSGAITSDYTCYDTANGEFTYQTSNCTASLRELKDNIQSYTTGLADALALKPSTFFMKNEHELGEEIGLIAQDTASVNRDLAVYQDGKLRSVQYDRMGVVAVAAIQDMQHEIDSLREQLHVAPKNCNVFCRWREWMESL